jgi:allophanate hydrolase subunit 1
MVLFSPTFTVVDAGPTAVRAIVSGADKIKVRKHVHALAKELGSYDMPGLVRITASNDALTVEFDPSLVESSTLKRSIRLVNATITP